MRRIFAIATLVCAAALATYALRKLNETFADVRQPRRETAPDWPGDIL
jgi:hypothetical protein